MGKYYEIANEEEYAILKRVMKKHHERLMDLETRIDLLWIYSDDDNPLKKGGYPCYATVKILGLKDRTKGAGDAEIIVDGNKRKGSSRILQAIFDHELTHLTLVRDKFEQPKTDDLGRPKLSMRLHDRQFGWFDDVASRWKGESVESKQIVTMLRDFQFVQSYLPGFDPFDMGRDNREARNADFVDRETDGES